MKKFVAMLAACAALLTGCNAASVVNHNIKAEADNFSVYRKFTAVNLRNNYSFSTIDNKSTTVCHERNVSHINIFLEDCSSLKEIQINTCF